MANIFLLDRHNYSRFCSVQLLTISEFRISTSALAFKIAGARMKMPLNKFSFSICDSSCTKFSLVPSATRFPFWTLVLEGRSKKSFEGLHLCTKKISARDDI